MGALRQRAPLARHAPLIARCRSNHEDLTWEFHGSFRAFARLPLQRHFAKRRIHPRLEACAVCESRLRISVVQQSLAQKQNFR